MPPTPAFAWKMKTHAYSANLVWDEATAFDGTVQIPPYGSFAIKPEYYDAINAYPRAYRAGAIGPDGYPDIYIGQAFIHPAPAGGFGTYSDEWLQQQWNNVQAMPPGEAKKEALAFVLGYLTHSAGDLFGHDYINDLSGGEFPAIADAKESDALQNIIARHNVTEAYIDSKIPAHYTDTAGDHMQIQAPRDFVVESLITNGGVPNGPNRLLSEFDGSSASPESGIRPARLAGDPEGAVRPRTRACGGTWMRGSPTLTTRSWRGPKRTRTSPSPCSRTTGTT